MLLVYYNGDACCLCIIMVIAFPSCPLLKLARLPKKKTLLTGILLTIGLMSVLNLHEQLQLRTATDAHAQQLLVEPDKIRFMHPGKLNLKKSVNTSVHQGHRLSKGRCLDWVSRAPKPPYFLSVVLLVRIYKEDKANLTTKELKMWLQYLRYAGVEHVYVYDAWVHQNESQLNMLKDFQEDAFITYIDWHTHNPYTIGGTQVAAYRHCVDTFSHENQWQAAIDIDEYPFSPKDTFPGFLYRYLKDYGKFHPSVSELSMQNFLFLGKPLDKELMIERLFRRTHGPSNTLVKPVYKPNKVVAGIHHNGLKSGSSVNAPYLELRMNHYWGARLQNWGEDTPEILQMTQVDSSIQPIIDAFKNCERYVRHYLE